MSSRLSSDLDAVDACLRSLASRPEDFIAASPTLAGRLRGDVARVFAAAGAARASRGGGAVQLYVEGFDAEQVWAQVDAAHAPILGDAAEAVAVLEARAHALPDAPTADTKGATDSGGAAPKLKRSWKAALQEKAAVPQPTKTSDSARAGKAAKAASATKEAPADDDAPSKMSAQEKKRVARRQALMEADDPDEFDDDDGADSDGGEDDDADVDVEDADLDANDGGGGADFGDEENDSADDLERFCDEGDSYMARLLEGGGGAEEDGAGTSDDDDESFDINAPIPDGDDKSSSRKRQRDLQGADARAARLAEIRSAGLKYADVWGDVPPPGARRERTESAADDDWEEENDSSEHEDGDRDGGDDDDKGDDYDDDDEDIDDAFREIARCGGGGGSGGGGGGSVTDESEDDFIDSGLGEGGKDDEDDDEEDADEGDEDMEPEEEKELGEDDDEVNFDDVDGAGGGGDGGAGLGALADGSRERVAWDAHAASAVATSMSARERARLVATVGELEREALAPKPWTMRGEVASKDRPVNSLLSATLDVPHAVKLAPPVTVAVSSALEDMIRQRIADSAFDDPVPPQPGARTGGGARAAGADALAAAAGADISTDKPSAGLADEYAAAFVRAATGGSADADKVARAEAEVEALAANVFARLDALSNFFFTPTPGGVTGEVSVAPPAALAALRLEEVGPGAAAPGRAAAPREIFAGGDRGRAGILQSSGEMDAAARKASRRANKAASRRAASRADREERAVGRVGLGNKHATARALADVRGAGSLKDASAVMGKRKRPTESAGTEAEGSQHVSSAQFFAKLEEDARTTIRETRAGDGAIKKSAAGAARYKLG